MAVTFITALACEDVRTEISGKLIAIGAYTGELYFDGPSTVLKLVLLANFNVKGRAEHQINIRVRTEDGEHKHEMNGTIENDTDDGAGWVPISVPTMEITKATGLIGEFKRENGKWQKFFSLPVRNVVVPDT